MSKSPRVAGRVRRGHDAVASNHYSTRTTTNNLQNMGLFSTDHATTTTNSGQLLAGRTVAQPPSVAQQGSRASPSEARGSAAGLATPPPRRVFRNQHNTRNTAPTHTHANIPRCHTPLHTPTRSSHTVRHGPAYQQHSSSPESDMRAQTLSARSHRHDRPDQPPGPFTTPQLQQLSSLVLDTEQKQGRCHPRSTQPGVRPPVLRHSTPARPCHIRPCTAPDASPAPQPTTSPPSSQTADPVVKQQGRPAHRGTRPTHHASSGSSYSSHVHGPARPLAHGPTDDPGHTPQTIMQQSRLE